MAVKHCSKCNEDNVYSANICAKCGNSLTDAVVYGSKSKDIIEIRDTCPDCNEKIKPGARNCSNCGSFLAKTHTSSGRATYRQSYNYSNISGSTKALLIIATILFPIIGLILGGVYITSDDYEKHDLGVSLLILGIIMAIVGIIIGVIYYNNSVNTINSYY